ncbi:MAG: RsmD family RNA methyltransferase [Alistipes sp.]|nr:RsmD family RNA methyltransferase [Alistipes sp.]
MTQEDFDNLCREEIRRVVEENRHRDPLEVALDKRVPHAALVATQVKYLKRAEAKLPSYAAAGCILPPRAFEQASSEEVSACHHLAGDRVLDLTCGLGVDALTLSRSFREVVTLERDPLLAAITRENFRRLGATNITLINTSAEEYLPTSTETFDWIYADPDRRNAEGRKQVRLEDCSPNILALRESLQRLAPRLCLKNSPLFDIEEAFRLFPRSRVEVLSRQDECKEVVIYTGEEQPMRVAVAVGRGQVAVAEADYDRSPSPQPFEAERYRWLIIPDVALQKARLVAHHLRSMAWVGSENGYAFAEEPPTEVLGRVFAIDRIEPFNPKALKRLWKGQKVEILKREFHSTPEAIRRQIGAREGSDHRLAFTEIDGRGWTIFLK